MGAKHIRSVHHTPFAYMFDSFFEFPRSLVDTRFESIISIL